MGDLDLELQRRQSERHQKGRESVDGAQRGRSLISEFLEKMHAMGVPATPIFEQCGERERIEGRRKKPTEERSRNWWRKAGDGWMLRDLGADDDGRSHLGYEFIIPGQGIAKVQHETSLPRASKTETFYYDTREGVYYGRVRFIHTVEVSPEMMAQIEHAYRSGRGKFYKLSPTTRPDDSDVAYAGWSHKYAVEYLAGTVEQLRG